MKVITRQSLANEAAQSWARQYKNSDSGLEMWEKLQRLEELGANPEPDAVDSVIGNTAWTKTPRCTECCAESVDVVEVGEPFDYDSKTAYLCSSCLLEAVGEFIGR